MRGAQSLPRRKPGSRGECDVPPVRGNALRRPSYGTRMREADDSLRIRADDHMKDSYSLYEEVQILLAGIRLFRHREKRLPSLEELAEFTHFSGESVHHLCNRLEKIGALERIRGAFVDRICLKNPWEAEALREVPDSPDIG